MGLNQPEPKPEPVNKFRRLSDLVVRLRSLEGKIEDEIPFDHPDYDDGKKARFGISEYMSLISLVAQGVDERTLTHLETTVNQMEFVANIWLSDVIRDR